MAKVNPYPKFDNQEKCSCPKCGSKHTNQVSPKNFYCMDCMIEFDHKTRNAFVITYGSGTLVDYYVNEFECLV